MEEEGGYQRSGKAGDEEEKHGRGLKAPDQCRGGDIGYEEKGQDQGEKNTEPTRGGFPGESGNLEDAVITEEDGFGLDDPKGEGDQAEQQGVVRQESGQNKKEISQKGGKGGGDM
jgi:hypothetical protein